MWSVLINVRRQLVGCVICSALGASASSSAALPPPPSPVLPHHSALPHAPWQSDATYEVDCYPSNRDIRAIVRTNAANRQGPRVEVRTLQLGARSLTAEARSSVTSDLAPLQDLLGLSAMCSLSTHELTFYGVGDVPESRNVLVRITLTISGETVSRREVRWLPLDWRILP